MNRVTAPLVPLPELVDQSLTGARAILRSNQLKLGKTPYRPSPYANLVLEMRYEGEKIEAGAKVPKGAIIDLIIGNGTGSDRRETPKLVGQTFEVAEFILLGKDLSIGIVELVQGDTTDQESIVVKQYPQEGRFVKAGQPIDLWIIPASDTLNFDISVIDEENQE